MPCSGLKSDTSVTPGAACSTSMVLVPSRARPVWLVTSPTRLPRRTRELIGREHVDARQHARRRPTGGARAAGRAPKSPPDEPRRPAAGAASQRGGHDGGDAGAEGRHVALAVGVDAVREEDHEGPGDRIDPERRPGPPGVPERADREEIAAVHREARVDVPAEAAHLAEGRRRGRAASSAPPRKARAGALRRACRRQQHPAEPREVGGRAEQPACPATPPIRRAVGSCTVPRSIAARGPPHGQASGVHASVGAMRAAARPAAGTSCRACRAARRCASARRRRAAGRSTRAHDLAEQEEVDVAVDQPLARRRPRALPRRRGGSRSPRPGTPGPGRGRRAGPRRASADGGW